MAGVTFEIVEKGAVLGESGSWRLEINKVSWNGNYPKWDIRPWDVDHTQCGKGIALSDAQLDALAAFLRNRP